MFRFGIEIEENDCVDSCFRYVNFQFRPFVSLYLRMFGGIADVNAFLHFDVGYLLFEGGLWGNFGRALGNVCRDGLK